VVTFSLVTEVLCMARKIPFLLLFSFSSSLFALLQKSLTPAHDVVSVRIHLRIAPITFFYILLVSWGDKQGSLSHLCFFYLLRRSVEGVPYVGVRYFNASWQACHKGHSDPLLTT